MKKSTMLACAGIVIVSFSPFLGGCASPSIATEPATTPDAQEVIMETDGNFEIPTTLGEEDATFAKVISNENGVVIVEPGKIMHDTTQGIIFEGTGANETFKIDEITLMDANGNKLSDSAIGQVGFTPESIVVIAKKDTGWLVNPGTIAAEDLSYNAGM